MEERRKEQVQAEEEDLREVAEGTSVSQLVLLQRGVRGAYTTA
jgi:hypothetical protein